MKLLIKHYLKTLYLLLFYDNLFYQSTLATNLAIEDIEISQQINCEKNEHMWYNLSIKSIL